MPFKNVWTYACLSLLSFSFQCIITYQFAVLMASFICLSQFFERFDKLFHFSLKQLVLPLLLFLCIFQLSFCYLQFCYGFFEFFLLRSTSLYKLGFLHCQHFLETLQFFRDLSDFKLQVHSLTGLRVFSLKLLFSNSSLLTFHYCLSAYVHKASIALSINTYKNNYCMSFTRQWHYL